MHNTSLSDRASAEEPMFLGIDGGGTKTEFVVTTQDGSVRKRFLRQGSNPNDVGAAQAQALICDGIREALSRHPTLTAVFCGIAGIAAGDHRSRLIDCLRHAFPALRCDADTDSANLFAADPSANMAVVSGTGSVVFVRRGQELLRLGGWGYLLDEGGSGYDIGRDALRIALSEEDSLREQCRMSRLLLERLKSERVWDAIDRIYHGGRAYIASLSDVVFTAYRAGDPQAAAILRRNAAQLARLVDLGITQYGAAPRAIAGGGVFERYGADWLPLLAEYTQAEFILTGLPPVYGACRRAVSLGGHEISDQFFYHFKDSYGGAL